MWATTPCCDYLRSGRTDIPLPIGAFQQTTSGLVRTNPQCYEASSVGCLAIYGFEYKPGYDMIILLVNDLAPNPPFCRFDDGYITWISEGKRTWTLMGTSMAPDTAVEIGARPIPLEPMVRPPYTTTLSEPFSLTHPFST